MEEADHLNCWLMHTLRYNVVMYNPDTDALLARLTGEIHRAFQHCSCNDDNAGDGVVGSRDTKELTRSFHRHLRLAETLADHNQTLVLLVDGLNKLKTNSKTSKVTSKPTENSLPCFRFYRVHPHPPSQRRRCLFQSCEGDNPGVFDLPSANFQEPLTFLGCHQKWCPRILHIVNSSQMCSQFLGVYWWV